MPTFDWPHPYLPHAICQYLSGGTAAGTRVTTGVPRQRVYPLLVVQPAGLGPLGTDAAIQADEVRLQVDSWAERRDTAGLVAAQVLRLLDARFPGALKDTVLTIEDEASPGSFYLCKIETIRRSGGGNLYFDDFAHVWRETSFWNVKINL
jgi:hypothetical protein